MRVSQRSRAKYPLATISAYGFDNRQATKLVVGILRRAEQKDPNPMRSWSTDAGDVRSDPVIATELADWLRSQGVKDTLSYDRIIGCPHEEGIDYPVGRTCPRCPFWANIDRFTHNPKSLPAPKMSPDQVLIELGRDRTTHPLEALASADAHRGVLTRCDRDRSRAARSRGSVRVQPPPLKHRRPRPEGASAAQEASSVVRVCHAHGVEARKQRCQRPTGALSASIRARSRGQLRITETCSRPRDLSMRSVFPSGVTSNTGANPILPPV